MHLYGPQWSKGSEGGYGNGKPFRFACWPLAVRFLGALLLAVTLVAAERTDIALKDGRVLKAARIVSIGDSTVTVSHAGGVLGVPIDLFPLDVLGRARVEIEATAAAKKAREAESLSRVADRRAEDAKKKQEELQIRLAEANVRARSQSAERVSVSSRAALEAEKKLLALKAKFPPKATPNHGGKLGIDVPHVDVWSYYHGMFQTTTVEALPRTISMVEKRVAEDIKRWSQRPTSSGRTPRHPSVGYQAEGTVLWLQGDLRRFIDEAKQLVPGK